MKLRLSIFSKILLWFFLNLVVLAAVFLIFFQIRFHVPPDSLLAGSTTHKTISLYRMIRHDLNTTRRKEWDSLLERYGNGFDADLMLVSLDGRKLAGSPIDLPSVVTARVRAWREKFRCTEPPTISGRNGRGPHHRFRRVMRMRTTDPVRYWLGIPMPVADRGHHHIRPALLLISTDSLTGSGFFPDIKPVLSGAIIIIVISMLWWLPMVRHITKPLKLMTRATEEIANGTFNIRIDERGGDEIARLGRSINRMSQRLENFITGQKRFLSDAAHELCSPIARLKMGLGVLENRDGKEKIDHLKDIEEEADNIAELVNEILSFSRADISPDKVAIAPVYLEEVIRKCIERENTAVTRVETEIPADMKVLCNRSLLARAVSNLLRNAVRYAGSRGPVLIRAHKSAGHAVIEVSDSGHGIPEQFLDRIFDPFFRLETHRSRETGGAGLGLAIVKTCIEACRGTVTAANMEGGGLKITIKLAVA